MTERLILCDTILLTSRNCCAAQDLTENKLSSSSWCAGCLGDIRVADAVILSKMPCPGFPSTCQRGKIEEIRFAWWSHYFQQTIAICVFSVDSLSAFCLQDVSSLYLICIIIKNSVSSFQMQFFSTWSLEIIPASLKNGSTYEAIRAYLYPFVPTRKNWHHTSCWTWA